MVKTRSRTNSVVVVDDDDPDDEVVVEVDSTISTPSTSTKSVVSSSASKASTSSRTKENNKTKPTMTKKKRKSTGSNSTATKKVIGNGSILAYFKGSTTVSSQKSDEESVSSEYEAEKEPKKIKIDSQAREFLNSGVPDVVLRQQKLITEKKSNSSLDASGIDDDDFVSSKLKSNPKKRGRPRKIAKVEKEKPKAEIAEPSEASSSSMEKSEIGKGERKKVLPVINVPTEEELSDDSSSLKSVQEEEQKIQPRRSLRSRGVISYSYRQTRSPSSSRSRSPTPRKKRESKSKRMIDMKTKEFLESGVPDVVAKKARNSGVVANGACDSSRKRKQRKRKVGTIKSYFVDESSSSSESSDTSSPKKETKKVLDPMTRAFLDSGVPEVVVKAQKCVEQKKVEDDYMNSLEFFPKLQQVSSSAHSSDAFSSELLPPKFALIKEDEEDLSRITSPTNYFLENKRVSTQSYKRSNICCGPILNLALTDEELGVTNLNAIPWIEECRIDVHSLNDLCCDKEALRKLTFWLKQWKTDIKDDGGTSRKIELKKKRRDSDDDFVTSGEDEEDLKKKSVLLTGPPGCGKTSAVYSAAKHYGFHVVEVNFSSRRPGKEVLQRVEEAVLSHRLESTQNCLLLFEDIDLVDPKEDEGFHSAVAQLITTAVRPIVMTTSCLGQLSLDPKLEKKDPLVIQFAFPSSTQIVRKALQPMILNRASIFTLDEEASDGSLITSKLSKILDSICRHGRNDVRQIINQTQYLFTFSNSVNSLTCVNSHQHSIQSDMLVDLGFIRSSDMYNSSNPATDALEDCDENDMGLSVKARKRMCLKKLDSISEVLSFVCDLDTTHSISSIHKRTQFHDPDELSMEIGVLKYNYLDPNFCDAFFNSYESGVVNQHVAQSLILDCDDELKNNDKGYQLFDEIGEYCDNIYSDGGWESASYVRTIIKSNMIDAIGSRAKRNGRVTSYFNRLDRAFTSRICESFGFHKELSRAKDVVKNTESFL